MNDATTWNSPEAFTGPGGGVLLVDKPAGWTSFDVVKKIRGALRVKKVGHAGTLDPIATGLLILCSGAMTRSIQKFQDLDKRYTGTLMFGATTPSYDADTPVNATHSIDGLTEEAAIEAARGFLGPIEQIPPMYSALRVEGRRLYQLARKGVEIERRARSVEIRRFDLHDFDPPTMRYTIDCTKGTYVRSLVHDLGQRLGVGAHVTALRRDSIGPHSVADAWTLDALIARAASRAGTPAEAA